MFPLATSAGARAALASFGVKEAGEWNKYLDEVKRQGIGQPQEAWKQFRKGTLFHPNKGLIGRSLPKSPGEIAAMLAWPIMGSFLSARANPDIGGGEIAGDFLGRSAGSLLGSPLGAVGTIGGGMLMAPVGRALGATVDSSRNPDVVPHE